MSPSSSRRPQRSTILPSTIRKMLMPRSTTCRPVGDLTHHRAAVGAMGDEMLHEEIIFGDHVLDVAAPIGKGLAEHAQQPGACPSGPSGEPGSGGSWLMNSGSRYRSTAVRSPLVNKRADELFDESACFEYWSCGQPRLDFARHRHPSKVGCFPTRMRGRIAVWTEAAWSRGARMIWCVCVTQD